MKKTPEFVYFLIGFALLTIILVVLGISRSRSTNFVDNDAKSIKEYMKEKTDIIEPEPMLLEPRDEVEQSVVSYRSRAKDIIKNDRPLPLLPKEPSSIDPGILQEKGILKNLYKESNRYYINDNEENQPKFNKGIKD